MSDPVSSRRSDPNPVNFKPDLLPAYLGKPQKSFSTNGEAIKRSGGGDKALVACPLVEELFCGFPNLILSSWVSKDFSFMFRIFSWVWSILTNTLFKSNCLSTNPDRIIGVEYW